MRYVILALLLLALPSRAQELSETEKALLEESRLWAIVSGHSTSLTDYFKAETEALQRERQDLTSERDGLQQERTALDSLRKQLASERKQIAEDSKRIDEREKRVKSAERLVRAAPWVAVGVAVLGAILWESVDAD